MCPPLPEVWAIVCPGAQAIHHFQEPAPDNPDEPRYRFMCNGISIKNVLFNPELAWGAFSKLAVPDPLPHARDVPLFPAASKKSVAKLSRLETLPAELLCMIVAESGLQKSDIVALGLSSTPLWAVVVPHVQASYRAAPAPWAGRMFWCQGSYAAELPDAFLAQAREDAEKGEEWAARIEEMLSAGEKYMFPAQRFFWNAKREYEVLVNPRVHEEGWIKAAKEHRVSSGIGREWWKVVKGGLACPNLWPQEREWVLRNLTTREFVEAGGLRERARKKKKKKCTISFNDVLLLQTYWSAPSVWGVATIENGGWVGHRFDIVTGEKQRAEGRRRVGRMLPMRFMWVWRRCGRGRAWPRAPGPGSPRWKRLG